MRRALFTPLLHAAICLSALTLWALPSDASVGAVGAGWMGAPREALERSLVPLSGAPASLETLERLGPDALTLQLDFLPVARVTYTVAPGDTLLSIARRYSVTVREIQRWNNLRGDRIVIGQRLTIHTRSSAGSQERVRHQVRSGETGIGIARRYRVSLENLRRWNPDANIDRLRIGQTLTVYTTSSSSSSSSSSSAGSGAVGSATNGRLADGVRLVEGAGLSIRNPERSWGTQLTVDSLRTAHGRMAAHFADETTALVGDVSLRNGGRMTPHRSHQNGLDADVAIFALNCIGTLCPMQVVTADTVDVVRQWYVFEEWLRAGVVEFIFLDYALQRPLYEYAKERGASDAELLRWFQYPRGRSASVGVIRHESGHANHYHVRFRNQG